MRIRSSARRHVDVAARPTPVKAFAPSAIPSPDGSNIDHQPAPPEDGQEHHPLSERIRELRAAIVGSRIMPSGVPITLVVADPEQEEGASRLAADLAVASARLGYNVLLVDANIAHPDQHRLFSLPNDHGVSDMAADGSADEAAIRGTAVQGLSLITAGQLVDNPAETIERLHLCDRLRRIGRKFDTILVDVTAQDGPEAAAAAVGSDGVILAVRRGRTPIALIKRTIAAFADRRVESLGLVPVG